MGTKTRAAVKNTRKRIGAGTTHAMEIDPKEIVKSISTPVKFTLNNVHTGGEDVEFEFPFDANQARSLAVYASMTAEDERAAEDILSVHDSILAITWGDQHNYMLTDREKMLIAAYFDLGTKVGNVFGVVGDDLRKEAKRLLKKQLATGKSSPRYGKHAKEIIPLLDEYISGGKQETFILQVKEISGYKPEKATVRAWRSKRKAGEEIWHEEE